MHNGEPTRSETAQEETKWGTDEWSEFWGDELDALMESFSGDIANLESGQAESVVTMMRELDPPDLRSVAQLIEIEKRELISRAREWARDYPDISVGVVVKRDGIETVVPWVGKISVSELADIRFARNDAVRTPPKEKKEMTKAIELKGTCSYCGHVTDLNGVVKYTSGGWGGEITIDDRVYSANYEPGYGWSISIDCVCTTDIDPAHPGRHRIIIVKSKF